MKIWLLLLCLSLFMVSTGSADDASFMTLTIKGKQVRVEAARTEREKEKGLMFREKLGTNEGMLFIYQRPETLTFWMKNTRIPLSIAFADERGIIVDIQDMEPFSLAPHASLRPAKYALEMNQGWFERNGVKIGDVIRFPSGLKK